ncbi:hypothetical protein AGMMS50212_14850 [Spirochaetia bacterium]|nr:hypothetical protein AGMMS50212_14850 [Spirochaetia bacterium]
MKEKTFFALLVFLFVPFFGLYAVDFTDGRIKLTIDEKIGRFNLYYMTDVDKQIYEPLFWDRDKRTSYLSASVDGKEYKLGENKTFKTFLRGTDKKPVLAFESSLFTVTEEFSFIRTAGSGVSNGVRIDIRIENWSTGKINAGLRLLIDTFLGERNNPNFRTDLQPIGSELVITKTTHDQYWLSRNKDYGLMGSVFVDGIDPADFVMFANWKRLNDAKFMTDYIATRNFNAMPFSAKDSAVCYYLEVMPLERWAQRTMTVLLAAEDQYGFDANKIKPQQSYETYKLEYAAGQPEIKEEPPKKEPDNSTGWFSLMFPIGSMRFDLLTLRELVNKVDAYIASGANVSETELKVMEGIVEKLEARYSSVFNKF